MQMQPLRFLPGFASDHSRLFDWLQTNMAWDERMRARRTASFGVAYDYSQIAYPNTPMPSQLHLLCEAIETELGFRPDNCLMNDYRNGTSKMGYHADQVDRMAPDTGVAILSFGAVRSMTFRLREDHEMIHALDLTAGSLLYMPASMQRHWQHAIPAHPDSGRRISLSFRKLI